MVFFIILKTLQSATGVSEISVQARGVASVFIIILECITADFPQVNLYAKIEIILNYMPPK